MMDDRQDPFERDELGQTELMRQAALGDLERVKNIIFALAGTGLSPQRAALIRQRDQQGRTAIDIAEASGQVELAQLLARELRRMEWYE